MRMTGIAVPIQVTGSASPLPVQGMYHSCFFKLKISKTGIPRYPPGDLLTIPVNQKRWKVCLPSTFGVNPGSAGFNLSCGLDIIEQKFFLTVHTLGVIFISGDQHSPTFRAGLLERTLPG